MAEQIKLGKPDANPDDPSHVKGVKQGNEPGNYDSQPGHLENGQSTAERSTGVAAKARNPIHPKMPNLSPA